MTLSPARAVKSPLQHAAHTPRTAFFRSTIGTPLGAPSPHGGTVPSPCTRFDAINEKLKSPNCIGVGAHGSNGGARTLLGGGRSPVPRVRARQLCSGTAAGGQGVGGWGGWCARCCPRTPVRARVPVSGALVWLFFLSMYSPFFLPFPPPFFSLFSPSFLCLLFLSAALLNIAAPTLIDRPPIRPSAPPSRAPARPPIRPPARPRAAQRMATQPLDFERRRPGPSALGGGGGSDAATAGQPRISLAAQSALLALADASSGNFQRPGGGHAPVDGAAGARPAERGVHAARGPVAGAPVPDSHRMQDLAVASVLLSADDGQ